MRLILVIFLLSSKIALSQELLVNGGFEEENICSEYKVNCAPEAWIYTVPSFIYYFKDARLSHAGHHFVALIAGHTGKPFYRTYVRTRLLCSLHKGNQYQLRFFIRSRHPLLDSMGIYFSGNDFLFEKGPYRSLTPSLFLADGYQPPSLDTTWQEVVLHYTATGEEAFMAIGNFSRLDVNGPTHIDRENNFFVLLDDISMKPMDPGEKICPGWQTTLNDIYSEDERHEYLDRMIKLYRGKSRPVQ